MSFTGNPGTGKTTVAMRMAQILHRLGYVRKGHLVAVTRDDLVGQYIGHTAPKTKEVLKKAMGGVLFIDEAYYLYRPENERDYGQEAIEILLQVMENQRDDLVVILAGYQDRMEHLLPEQSRHELAHRAPPRLPGLRRAGAAGDRRQDAGRAGLPRWATARHRRSSATSTCASRSRISPMPAACATRSTARGCARRAACSRERERALDGRGTHHHRGAGHPGQPRVPRRREAVMTTTAFARAGLRRRRHARRHRAHPPRRLQPRLSPRRACPGAGTRRSTRELLRDLRRQGAHPALLARARGADVIDVTGTGVLETVRAPARRQDGGLRGDGQRRRRAAAARRRCA